VDSAIYVICCNLYCDTNPLLRVEYWIQTVVSTAPKAPFIIVCSYYKERQVNFKEFKNRLTVKLKPYFPQLIDILPISNNSLKGTKSIIRELVNIALLPLYKKRLKVDTEVELPFKIFEARVKCVKTSMEVPFMYWEQWKTFALVECNLPQVMVIPGTEYLQQIGLIIWFRGNELQSKDFVILDNAWLIQVFFEYRFCEK